jgi:Zn-dependent protease with chaperone function
MADQMDPNSTRPAMRRRPDASSSMSVVMALPAFLCSLAVVALAGSYILPGIPWLIPVVWIASGAVLLVPSIEPTVSRLLFDVRPPSPDEMNYLWQPWQSVCQVAGVAPGKFVLMVEDSHDLNAFAAGGRTVAVTQTSLRLPPKQLEAVLAHELGHHLSGHAVVGILSWWYALPARGAAFLVGLAVRFVLVVAELFARFGGGVGALMALLLSLIVLTMLAFVGFWLLLIPLTAPLLAWVSRIGERHADRTAAELGYGPHLVEVLHRWIAAGGQRPESFRARMLATHPSPTDRINRLHGLLR